MLDRLAQVMLEVHAGRPERLRQRDRERVLRPDWFQSPDTIGYVAYTDLFAKDLKGVASKISYMQGLGVSYLHLMPLLKPREGPNDGGYAVQDYRAVRSDLGTMADLQVLTEKLHAAGISFTLDLVLNHVAKEHEWAERARKGEKKYREYFLSYPDRAMPDRFEETLLEIFPDFAPGSFTYDDEMQAWVWTTFNSWQWDLNWANPEVFCEFADVIGYLANQGVDCLRLDAIAFIWKRLGTQCQGEPEVHAITQALRAFARIVSPALIFKAEAIVGPAQVGAYLGEGKHAGKVSDLAYHNSLMVQIWSALASQDGRLMELALGRFHAIPVNTGWGTYLRCHDDIGWAIDDNDAWRVGLNGHRHRMFLADYYTGKYPGSLAKGADFQLDPASGERRTAGSAASLVGIEEALTLGDDAALGLAVDRFVLGYAMVFGFGGIPLLYMGDEIGLPNHYAYTADPAKRDDNRWLNRPPMNWPLALAAASGDAAAGVASLIRGRIDRLISARRRLAGLHANMPTRVKVGRDPSVVFFVRNHPAGTVVQIYNLAPETRWIGSDELAGLEGVVTEHLMNTDFVIHEGIELRPLQALWLSN